MTTPFFETIRNDWQAGKISLEKYREAFENSRKEIRDAESCKEASEELRLLIKVNKPAIEAEEKSAERFSHYYNIRDNDIKEQLKTLSPHNAYEYLINYEIKLLKDIIPVDDLEGWGYHCREQIKLLKSGDIKKYVELDRKQRYADTFRDVYLNPLISEYKKRAEALPAPEQALKPMHTEEMYTLAKSGKLYTEKDLYTLREYIQDVGGGKLNDVVRICLELNSKYTAEQIAEIRDVSPSTIRGTKAWKNRDVG